jgi:hypothetical protein
MSCTCHQGNWNMQHFVQCHRCTCQLHTPCTPTSSDPCQFDTDRRRTRSMPPDLSSSGTYRRDSWYTTLPWSRWCTCQFGNRHMRHCVQCHRCTCLCHSQCTQPSSGHNQSGSGQWHTLSSWIWRWLSGTCRWDSCRTKQPQPTWHTFHLDKPNIQYFVLLHCCTCPHHTPYTQR